MTAHAADVFTLDEVNRLKIIQDVVDRFPAQEPFRILLTIVWRHA